MIDNYAISRLKRTKLTYHQHNALRVAATSNGGVVDGVDNGVLNSLLKKQFAREEGGRLLITALGRAAVEFCKINYMSKPSGLRDEDFTRYLRAWSPT